MSSRYLIQDVVTVDSLSLDNVSFIKFDVEGSESEAIEGARETILKCRPVMKIACYHRSEDVFAIVQKVLEILLLIILKIL